MATPDEWLDKLTRLRPDKAGGDPAPHKPLLLLVLLDMAERGELRHRELPLTPELAFRFCTLWKIVAHRRKQRPDIRYPFHHLKTNGFWSALDAEGRPSPHRNLTRLAIVPPELLACMMDPAWRERAYRRLIKQYFEPGERVALCELAGIQVPPEEPGQEDAEQRTPEQAQKQGRAIRFRLRVVAAYDYTCALTGYRLTTVSGTSIVDAAHIHQFSDSRNNDLCNGIALCKNAHWLFDNGLWTINKKYKVVVATDRFVEDSPDKRGLRQYHRQDIRRPNDPELLPSQIHLAWHRRKHGFEEE
jgi:putative restriction endonuclease